jgi:hypothetical protein
MLVEPTPLTLPAVIGARRWGRDGLHRLTFKRLAQLVSLLRRQPFHFVENPFQRGGRHDSGPQLRSLIANEYIMLRTLDALRASVQGHLEKHPTRSLELRVMHGGTARDMNLFIEYDAGAENTAFFGNTKIRRYFAY